MRRPRSQSAAIAGGWQAHSVWVRTANPGLGLVADGGTGDIVDSNGNTFTFMSQISLASILS